MMHKKRIFHIYATLFLLTNAAGVLQAGVTYESHTEAVQSTDATSITIGKPSNTVVGDLLIAVIATDKSTAISPPVGWTDIHQQGGGVTLGAWWKIAGTSEPSSYTFLWSTSEQAVGGILRYSGADPNDPINISNFASGRSDQPAAPTDTTTADSVLILRLFGADNDALPSPASDTYPSGANGHFALVSNAGTGSVTGAVADHLQPVSGATGEAVFTLTGDEKWLAGTIAIKPPPTVSFAGPASEGDESLNAALEVVLSAPSGIPVTVDYDVTGGDATGGGADYTLLGSGTVTFLPGADTVAIDIAIVDDNRKENNETIVVTISNPTNASLAPGGPVVHTYTINDNEENPFVQFSAVSSSGNEGVTPATLFLELSAPSDFNSSVDYAVTGGSATAADFTLLGTGTVSFSPGVTSGSISLAITDDALDEIDETVEVTISNPDSARLDTNQTHTYTINDNDASPVVQFTRATSDSAEGVATINLQLKLSTASERNVTVDYAVTGGTAAGAGEDYTIASGPATILAGQLTTDISLTIIPDALDELNESIIITLSNPVNATLGVNQSHTYLILDDDSPPQVEFTFPSDHGSEASTPANLRVRLSAPSGLNVTVNYSGSDITATGGGVDYTLAAGTLTIPAGADTAIIPIVIVNDALDEDNETFEVTLSNPVNASLGTNQTFTYTVDDNDSPPVVQFTLTASSGDEGSSPANLQLQLSVPSGKDVSIDYAVTGGSATSGVDYTLTGSTATIPAGATTAGIPVTIINDGLDEPNETIEVTLSAPVNATPGTNLVHTYTINDNDLPPAVEFRLSSSSGSESSSPANLALRLAATSEFEVTVDYVVTGGSATGTGEGADYTLAAGPATIPAGDTTANISVVIIDDGLYEGNETIQVTLTNPVNATLGANSIHTFTINDDDQPPSIQFALTTSSGSEATSPANLQLQLSAVSGLDATVNYGVTGGTALGGGVDYTLASGSVTISAGATTTSIPVTVMDDALDEPNETILVALSLPVNAMLGSRISHTYMILDDDPAPTVQFTYESSSGDESISPANLQVELSALSGRNISVNYSRTGGTAQSGNDFVLLAGTATIAAGDLTTQIPITVIDDALDEDNETVVVTLSAALNATLGAPSIHTYTITDNETQPIVEFSTSSSAGGEDVTLVNLQVALTFAADNDVSVNYTVTGGSASGGGIDYTLAAGVATIVAGETHTSIPITVVNDAIDEDNETIVVSITNPVNASLGANQTHTYTINDNDPLPAVQFATSSYSAGENTATVNLQVQLSAVSGRDVSVDYAVTGGTATGGGVDYTLAAGTVVLDAGVPSANIPIAVGDDALDEDNENIIITLSNPINAILGTRQTHTFTILDNDPLPSIQFTFTSSSGSEVTTPANLQLKLSAISGRDVTVDYSVSGGTASGSGVDYTLPAGTAAIPAGAMTANISVDIVNDARFELNETIQVTIATPGGATLGANVTHTYTIYDNDAPPVVQFTQPAFDGDEGVSPTLLQLELSAPSGMEVTLEYAVSGGSASGNGVDYTLSAGTATFPPGVAIANIPVTVVDDLLDENDETVHVTIYNPVNATLGAAQTSVFTIQDNDFPPTVQFSAAMSSGDEGSTPTEIQVGLSQESGLAVSVDYDVTGGSASGGGSDYWLLGSGTLVFPAGSILQTIALEIVDDALYEGNETIELTLSNPVNATLEPWGTNAHTYSILENDEPPTVDFVTLASSSDEFITTVNMQLRLSGTTFFDVTVDYMVSGGTATGDGIDFTLATGTATIPAGLTTGTFPVSIVDDALFESDETIQITLFNPRFAVLGTNTVHTYTISDNDGMPILSFKAVGNSALESLTPAVMQIQLSAVSGLDASVDYTVTGGTAKGDGIDYTLESGTATIFPGSTADSILFNIVDDLRDEYDETVRVTLSNPVNTSLGAITTYTYTILDNDDPPSVQFTYTELSGDESISPALLQLELSALSGLDVSVYYQVTGGTVSGGTTDFILSAGVATIPAGEPYADISLQVIDDIIGEFDEEVEVTISDPINASLGANTVHTYTILDNEPIPILGFTAPSGSVEEGYPTYDIAVSMDGLWDLNVTIEYTVRELTATARGTDFTLADTIVATIYAGQDTTYLPAGIHEDVLHEHDEIFQVVLTNVSYVILGSDSVFTLTILDNDTPPTLAFGQSSSAGPESLPASIQIGLDAVSGRNVEVNYTLTGSSATAAVDYVTPSGKAVIAAGQTAADIVVNIINDLLDEEDESIVFTLIDPVNADLGLGTVHTYSIQDDDSPPFIQIEAINHGHEHDTLAHMPVLLSTVSGRAVTVEYSVTGGTAKPDTDFVLEDGILEIPAGSWGADILATIIDDGWMEDDETIVVTIANPTDATIQGNAVHTFTINDNDAPTKIQFDLSSSSVQEDASSHTLRVELLEITGAPVNVEYKVVGGTATNTTDYTRTPGIATIPPGMPGYTNIIIDIHDDGVYEGDETFVVLLHDPVNANLGENTTHTVTILENEAPPQLAFQLGSLSNGESITDPPIIVQLSTPADLDVTFDYAVTGGTAIGGGVDYNLASGSKTITAGQTSTTIPVVINPDGLDENNEFFVIALLNVINATIGTDSTHTYTIQDDDNEPDVFFSGTTGSGSEEIGLVNLVLELSAISGRDVSVDYTVNGPAVGDSIDYTLASGPVTIPAGQQNASLSLSIVDDVLYELTESVILTLTDPFNAKLRTDNKTYTYEINDNDQKPTVAFTTVASLDSEGVTDVGLEVSLSAAAGVAVTVNYDVTGGSATKDGVDYSLSNGTLSIPAGELSAPIPINVVDDDWDEVDEETIIVTISNPTNALPGLKKVHTYTILDDDDPPAVSFVSAGSSGDETATVDTIRLRLSAPSQRPISVDFEVNGTASGSGVDYSLGSRSVEFAPGDTVRDISVTIFGDPFFEEDETIIVTLTNLINCAPGTYTAHTLTILDNDEAPPVFQLGAVATTGGITVPGYWNSTNASLEIDVPVGNATSLLGGSVQLQARAGAGEYQDVGESRQITLADTGKVMTMTLAAYEFEGVTGFDEGAEITVVAVISDAVGNSVTSADESSVILVDQMAPSTFTLGSVTTTGGTGVPGFWNMSNTGILAVAPLISDLTLLGGRIQLQSEADGTFQYLGLPVPVQSGHLDAGTIDISVAETEPDTTGVEELDGFSEGDRLAFRAILSDVAGNSRTGNPSVQQLLVDQTAPRISLSYSQKLAKQGEAVTITAAFDDIVAAPSINLAYASDPVSGNMSASSDPKVWTYTTVIPAGNDGEVTVDLQATDLAGNVLVADSVSGRTDLVVDNTPPLYALSYSRLVARQGQVVTLTATFRDTIQPPAIISIDFDGTDADILNQAMSMTASELVWTYFLTTPGGVDGSATATVTAYDRVGNLAEPESGAMPLLRVDNTPPSVVFGSPASDAFVRTADVSYTLDEGVAAGRITWIWEDNSSVTDNASPHITSLSGPELMLGTHIASHGLESGLVQGASYTVEVSATDSAGNTASTNKTGVTYDALPPDIQYAWVFDGLGADLDSSRSTSTITAHFSGFSDPVSGIALYEFAIGITEGGNEVKDWTANGMEDTVMVSGLELSYQTLYYVSVRATDVAGNVSESVSSDGIMLLDKPRLTASVVQNSLLTAYAQIFIVDSLGMADSVHLVVDGNRVGLAEVDSFTYVTTHHFQETGPHSLMVYGYSSVGDTTLSHSLGMALAKRGLSWVASSADGKFRAAGKPGSVYRDYYLLVVDSSLVASPEATGDFYRLADTQLQFDKPVRISMQPQGNEGDTEGQEQQAIYILQSNGLWEELPTVDDGPFVTAWSESAGLFRLGTRTIFVPQATSLHQNYPNPFNPSTTIVFDLGFLDGPEQRAQVAIYNLLGQHVKTLYNDTAQLGRYELIWHGLDKRGVYAASGVYFVRLTTDSGYHSTKKMLLVR